MAEAAEREPSRLGDLIGPISEVPPLRTPWDNKTDEELEEEFLNTTGEKKMKLVYRENEQAIALRANLEDRYGQRLGRGVSDYYISGFLAGPYGMTEEQYRMIGQLREELREKLAETMVNQLETGSREDKINAISALLELIDRKTSFYPDFYLGD